MSDFFYLLTDYKYRNEKNSGSSLNEKDSTSKEPLMKIKTSDGFAPKSFPDHPIIFAGSNLDFNELEEMLDSLDDSKGISRKRKKF